jgi:hypothetical protein
LINPAIPLFTTNNYAVPVCFMSQSDVSADAKTEFQNTIQQEWQAKTGVTFTGFGTCTSLDPPNVPIYMFKANPGDEGDWGGNGQEGVGARHGDGLCLGQHWKMCQPLTKDTDCGVQNATCVTGSQVRISVTDGRTMFHQVSVHEMGHVLGIEHEHQRPDGDDTSNRCVIPRSQNGDTAILNGRQYGSVPDPLSIMGYCNNWNGRAVNDPTLTPLDVSGGQLMYGRPLTATAEAGFAFAVNSFIPPANSWNTTAAVNTLTHWSTGSYTVTLPLNGRWGGNVQVTGFSGANHCKVTGWGSGGGNGATINVFCFTPAGAMVDTYFTTSFVGRSDTPGLEGGYVWSSDPTSASYTPTDSYVWNSTGQAVTISHSVTGVYTVTFVGQNWLGGTAEVTAYNGGGTEYCKLDSLMRVGTDKQVVVRCFSTTGSPANTEFSLRLSRVSPEGAPSYSYAIADQPTASSYTPAANNLKQFRGSAGGGSTGLSPMVVTRSATGAYVVDMPQMIAHDADADQHLYRKNTVNVVAVGTGPEYCTIGGWDGDPSGVAEASVRAWINCFNAAGNPADSKFMVNYASLLNDTTQPKIVATVERESQTAGTLGEGGMVLINGNIYFTRSFANVSGGQIMRVSASGGTPTALVTGESAVGLAGDANNLFWITLSGSIRRSTLSGGSLTTLASGQSTSGNPVIDATNVYFLVPVQQMGTTMKIMKVSRNGGTPTQLAVDDVTAMASDGTSLYWSATVVSTGGGRVVKIPIGGGNITTLASQGGGAIALESGTVYYSNLNNDVFKVSTSGGTSTQIATGAATQLQAGQTANGVPNTGGVRSLSSDGVNVYGIVYSVDPVIFKVGVNNPPAGQPTYLAWRQHSPGPIAVDSGNVYALVDSTFGGWYELHSMPK